MYDSTDPNHPANVALSVLKSHIGSGGHAWVQSKTNVGGGAWCAATMVATGLDAGLGGIIFPTKNQTTPAGFQSGILCAGGVCECIVKTYGGTRIDGPAWGKTNVTPAPGDLIVFLWDPFRSETISAYNNGNKKRYWSGSHVGMVEYVENGVVHTIEGNNNGTLRRSSYKINNVHIAFYTRPNWIKANGVVATTTATDGTYVAEEAADERTSTYQSESGAYTTQMFKVGSTKGYASIREIGFMDSTGQPSINTSGVKLAVVNYTGLLSHLFYTKVDAEGNTYYTTSHYDPDAVSYSTSTSSSYDNIDGLDPVPRSIVKFFQNKGYNTAAAIGIAANIQAESNYKTDAVGSNGTAFGLCQWRGDFGNQMKESVGSDWANNLTGQLNFLSDTLDSTFSSLKADLKAVENTQAGARRAADLFVRQYNSNISDITNASKYRQEVADDLWSKVVTESASESADYSNNKSVKKLNTAYGDVYLVWPIASVSVGKYSSGFGPRHVNVEGASSYHNGVDIGASQGTPIKCCAEGIVHLKKWNDARGYLVVINHGNQRYTLYQHMNSHSPLSEGAKVTAGQVIGYVGNTGLKNMAPHLHLEVQEGGKGILDGQHWNSQYQCYINQYCQNPAEYFPTYGSKS